MFRWHDWARDMHYQLRKFTPFMYFWFSYNLLITCFHESWIYQFWTFIMKFIFSKSPFFCKNKGLHRHFLYILMSIKNYYILCKNTKQRKFCLKKSEFIDSGFVKTCNESEKLCSVDTIETETCITIYQLRKSTTP